MAKDEDLSMRRGFIPLAKQTGLKLISNFAKDTKSEISLLKDLTMGKSLALTLEFYLTLGIVAVLKKRAAR